MTTLHLTDAQRDTFAACGLIVIDGEVTDCAYAASATEDNLRACLTLDGPCPKNCPTRAPEGWRILTEPCDTCLNGGTCRHCGQESVSAGVLGDLTAGCCQVQKDCPDCVGGLRVVTFTATCDMCDGNWTWVEPLTGRSGSFETETTCIYCERGVVTLGRFVLTMRSLDDGRFEITPERVP